MASGSKINRPKQIIYITVKNKILDIKHYNKGINNKF